MSSNGLAALRAVLAPEAPRDFPGRRWLRVLVRSLHILAITIYVGGCMFDATDSQLAGALHSVILTGALMLVTDLYRSCGYLREFRGVAMLMKIAVLVVALWVPAHRIPLLIALLLFSGVVSHMPGRYRHWVIGARADESAEPQRKRRRAAGRG